MDEPPEVYPKGDILVVDDKPENLRLLFDMLTGQGYDVRRVIDGKQALTAATSEPPDLILLDIMMPGLNGYEVCQLLKSQPRTKEIPVIFLSALKDVSEKVRGFDVGGVDYISKPFELREILARIENQLTIGRQRRQIAEQYGKLEELNQKLLRSNRELEQFASVVSHDLQQPLTSLKAFAQLLQIEYEGQFDEKAASYVDRIVTSATRMQRLIRDLLTYCGCDTPPAPLQLTDCNPVLEQVLSDLRLEIEATNATVTSDLLPAVMADPIQLGEVFQNLIGNAIKYRRDGVAPQVRITVSEEGRHWLFCVADNGIGIPEKSFDRIFKIFTRLHGFNKYPGTGIGLSICKKIVESYGGQIWVESTVGLGTKFYFKLKKHHR